MTHENKYQNLLDWAHQIYSLKLLIIANLETQILNPKIGPLPRWIKTWN